MIVLNVLYFKGLWNKKFDKDGTLNKDFHTTNGTHLVPMMTQDEYFKYGVLSEIKAKFVELPFEVQCCQNS